jgi:hypothetical protein
MIHFYSINNMGSPDLLVGIGMDVFVLGYPFGPGKTGLPVWKRGSIASEPDLVPQVENYLLVDTASRPGMSGSPVILRTYGTHMSRGDHPYTRSGQQIHRRTPQLRRGLDHWHGIVCDRRRIHQSLPKPPVQLLLVLAGYSESNTWRQFVATDQFRDLAFLFAIQSAAPVSMFEPPMKDSRPPQLTAATKELGATAMVPRSQLQVRSEVDEHSARAVFLARCSSLKTSDRKIRPLGEAE